MLVSNTVTAKECGNIYRISSVLRAHQKVHIYLKPHVWKDCGKAFIVNGQLTHYQKIYVRQSPMHVRNVDKPLEILLIIRELILARL